MIETIETGSPQVVGLKLSGTLHDDDYQRFVPMMEGIFAVVGKVRLFIQLEDFHGWDLHAIWDDLKFGVKHYSDFERIAMVGDRKWEEWMASFCKPFTAAKVKYFDRSEVDAARMWIMENEEDNRAAKEKDQAVAMPDTPAMWNDFPGFGV